MIVTKLKRLLTEDRLHHNRDQLKHIFSLLARQVARSEDTRYNHGIIKPQCSSTGTGTGTAAQAQLTTGTAAQHSSTGTAQAQAQRSSTGTTYNRHTARVWSPRKVGRIEFSDARMHIGQSRRWRFFKTKHRTFCLLQINSFTVQSILLIQISQFGDLAQLLYTWHRKAFLSERNLFLESASCQS